MKKMIAFTAVAGASLTLFAAEPTPVVKDVTMSQDMGRTVTINYTLANAPGIVTIDIQTNRGDGVWFSIGGKHLTYFAGDVNKQVEVGDHTITWQPVKAWPDNEVKENVKAVVSAWALDVPPDYMVASLSVPSNVFFYVDEASIPYGVTHDMYKTDYLVMRKIHAANVTWRMGSPTGERGRQAASEAPQLVTLTNDFYIGVYELTQRQYELMMNTRPSTFAENSDYAMRPVESVSYEMFRGAVSKGIDWPTTGSTVASDSFIYKLRSHTGLNGIDMPLSAWWEFACRAGNGSATYSGIGDASDLNAVARWSGNSNYSASNVYKFKSAEGGTAIVGSYKPNQWGLYDMLGNEQELCRDWFEESARGYDLSKGPASGTKRGVRGGSWDGADWQCRCAYRNSVLPSNAHAHYGFRIACSVDLK